MFIQKNFRYSSWYFHVKTAKYRPFQVETKKLPFSPIMLILCMNYIYTHYTHTQEHLCFSYTYFFNIDTHTPSPRSKFFLNSISIYIRRLADLMVQRNRIRQTEKVSDISTRWRILSQTGIWAIYSYFSLQSFFFWCVSVVACICLCSSDTGNAATWTNFRYFEINIHSCRWMVVQEWIVTGAVSSE